QAVIAALEGQDKVTFRLAPDDPGQPAQHDRGLRHLRSGIAKPDISERRRRDRIAECPSIIERHLRRTVIRENVGIGKFIELLPDRFLYPFGAISKTEVPAR